MMLLASVTNWEPSGVKLAGYSYVIRHEMEVQIVSLHRVCHLQRYVITEIGNVTSVYILLRYAERTSPNAQWVMCKVVHIKSVIFRVSCTL
jgi:hypothetical protein